MNVTGYEYRHLYMLPEVKGGPCITLCGKEMYGGQGQYVGNWSANVFVDFNYWCRKCIERFDLWKLGVTKLEGPD